MDVSFTERRRLSINNLNNSFSRRKSLVPVTEKNDNDDEAERIKRRKEALLSKRLSVVHSPLNKSVNLNEGAKNLKDHFDTCLHMYTHNKINSANAWNLHIIDYMRTLVDSKEELNNILQIASTSLDIGAKVYSLRVDDVYDEVLKLANKLTRLNFNDNKNDNKNSSNEEDIEENDVELNKKVKKKTKKKNRILDHEQHRITVSEYEESLKGVIPKYLYTSSNLFNNKLLNLTLLKSPGNCYELIVPELGKKHFWNNKSDNTKIKFKTIELKLEHLSSATICPQFNGFAIDLWDENNDNTFRSDNKDEVNYDETGLPIVDLDTENIDPQDNVMDITEEIAGHKALDELYITDMKPIFGKTYSGSMLEYSYRPPPSINEQFNIIGAWAGPAHWKLKSLRKNYKIDTGNVNQKPTKVKKLKPPSEPIKIDMNTWNKLDDILNVNKNKKKTRTNISNSFDACTLPEKLKIEENFWMRLNLIPQYKITIHQNDDLKKDLNVSNYDYNNPNDNQYCNDTMHSDGWEGNSNTSVNGEEFGGNADFENNEDDFNEDDYVTAPEMVPNNPVAYALRAKKMDMKKLKTAIWEELIEHDVATQMSNLNISEDKKIESKVLSEVYMKIPNKLSQTYAENLSSPLAFVALLHLANEHNLKITPSNNNCDIIISKD